MKNYRALILFLLFFSSTSLFSKSIIDTLYSKNYNAFKSGEFFEYKLYYGFFNASYASLELKEEILGDKEVFRASAIGRTTGLARLFFKVEDLYETYFDKNLVKPLKSTRNIYEGGYVKNTETTYDYDSNKAFLYNKLTNEEKEFKVGENIQDIVSTFYYLRKHLDISKLNPGDYIYVNIFFDSENYPFKMKFLGIENLKTKFGTIECMKLNPYMEAGRVFRSNKGLELWVTNDDNRVPIKVKANLRVGTIVADLTTFRGLTNPFKIVIND